MDPAVTAALEALREALAKSRGRRPAYLMLLFPDGATELLSLGGSMPETTLRTQGAKVSGANASAMEHKIIEVLKKAEKPLKGEAIALRAKVRYGGRIRTLLAEMLRRQPGEEGRLIHGPQGGYWLASRPLPDGN